MDPCGFGGVAGDGSITMIGFIGQGHSVHLFDINVLFVLINKIATMNNDNSFKRFYLYPGSRWSLKWIQIIYKGDENIHRSSFDITYIIAIESIVDLPIFRILQSRFRLCPRK